MVTGSSSSVSEAVANDVTVVERTTPAYGKPEGDQSARCSKKAAGGTAAAVKKATAAKKAPAKRTAARSRPRAPRRPPLGRQ